MNREYLQKLIAKYGMKPLNGDSPNAKTGVYVYTDHLIDELEQIMLHSNVESYPTIRTIFAPDVIRYTIFAPEEWL